MRSAAEGEHRTGQERLDGIAHRRAILPERWAIGTRWNGAWCAAAPKSGVASSRPSLSRAKVLTSPSAALDRPSGGAARTVDLVGREGKRSAQRRQARRRQGWKPEGARPRSGLDAKHESPVPKGDAQALAPRRCQQRNTDTDRKRGIDIRLYTSGTDVIRIKSTPRRISPIGTTNQ
jgi:hypothetical protein